jgi:hypothetical protein
MCLKTPHLKFLDVTNYLTPGFSYERFLKAYECSQTKCYFPYEWVLLIVLLKLFKHGSHSAFAGFQWAVRVHNKNLQK